MVFLDEVTIHVRSGRGGDGAVSFRREKYVPKGGPDGGDGGRGGSVIIEADEHRTTLIDFRSRRHYFATNGKPGEGNRRTGKSGQDLLMKVPVGVIAYEVESGRVLCDLTVHGQRAALAKGGIGGRGNSNYATSTHQTPRFAERGEPGEDREVRLELKLLADVGLIGYPNVGKSTLISRISAARPKIADYPFTTLVPNLGVVQVEEDSFVVADIPGLIEGAGHGAGLGHRFLKHVERTRLLVHILDVSGTTERDPRRDYEVINAELAVYSGRLAGMPQIVALNKMDVTDARRQADDVRAILPPETPVFEISAVTGEGVRELMFHIAGRLREIPRTVAAETEADSVVIGPPEPEGWVVRQEEDGVWVVSGKSIETLISRTDLGRDEAVQRLHRQLKSRGVLDKLAESGAKDGDTVRIGEAEFDYAE